MLEDKQIPLDGRVIPIEQAIKLGLISEKDIDVHRKQKIIERIRNCDYCRFRPETSIVCSDYANCHLVSEHIVNLREQLKQAEKDIVDLNKTIQVKEQKLEKIKEILQIHKDNKCVTCQKFDECFEQPYCDNVILQIIEGKENG